MSRRSDNADRAVLLVLQTGRKSLFEICEYGLSTGRAIGAVDRLGRSGQIIPEREIVADGRARWYYSLADGGMS